MPLHTPSFLLLAALAACLAISVPGTLAFGFPHGTMPLNSQHGRTYTRAAGTSASIRPQLDGASFSGIGVSRVGALPYGRRPTIRGAGVVKMQKPKGPLSFPPRITVLGGGNFGLALATILGNNQIPVTVLVRRQEIADALNKDHRHPSYLNNMVIPSIVTATTDPEGAFRDCSHVVHAVPCQYSRKYLKNIAKHLPVDTPIICTSKGIEAGTLCLMKDILEQETGTERELAFLSGPSFAKELVQGLVTAVVVASDSEHLANEVVELFGSETFRVFTSKDVTGVEIGGAVKNVIAIAAGMSEGLGLGTNAMSALVTRGCLEMMAVAKAYGSKKSTLTGLSGVGDTFGTCFGPLSRNRQLGFRLGQGEKLDDILASSTEVAEGYATSLSLVEFIDKKLPESFRKDLKYPILYGVADILKGNRTPAEGLQLLMTMPLRTEIYDDW